jgi:hypothetical protein
MNYTKEQITEAYENGTLFVKCINNVEDDEGIYNIKGKTYEIIQEITNKDDIECWVIECEESSGVDSMQIDKDDENFQLIIIHKTTIN